MQRPFLPWSGSVTLVIGLGLLGALAGCAPVANAARQTFQTFFEALARLIAAVALGLAGFQIIRIIVDAILPAILSSADWQVSQVQITLIQRILPIVVGLFLVFFSGPVVNSLFDLLLMLRGASGR